MFSKAFSKAFCKASHSLLPNEHRIMGHEESIWDFMKGYILGRKGTKFGLITDMNVMGHYADKIRELEGMVEELYVYSVKPGEGAKSREVKAGIEDFLIGSCFDRGSILIAFGGGVIGDVVGYVASGLYRGVGYIQVPTTLMSMVDSSMGGKTGISLLSGKNLLGTFYVPRAIWVSFSFIETLSMEAYRGGLAEVIKYGLSLDVSLYRFLVRHADAILEKDKVCLKRIIRDSIRVKTGIIKRDPYEVNLRSVLNFGHTVGHGIEKVMGYQMGHGECISIGMGVEAFISYRCGKLSREGLGCVKRVIERYGLGVSLPFEGRSSFELLYGAMLRDKKNRHGKVYMPLMEGVGRMHMEGVMGHRLGLYGFGGSFLMGCFEAYEGEGEMGDV